MAFESHRILSQLRRLSEAAPSTPVGTMVGWKAAGSEVYGVVIGRSGKDLLCLTTYDKTLEKDKGIRLYRDEAMSGKLPMVTPTVRMSLQRVPAAKAFTRSRLTGSALKPYVQAASVLQMEEATRWIQGAVKKPGRLRKILGVSKEDWEALSKEKKLAMINQALAGDPDDSERGALLLGKRFIGGEFKRKGRSEDMDFTTVNAKLEGIRQSLTEGRVLAEDAAESAFRQELRTWAANEFEGFLKDLDKKMLAIKKGKWPTHGMEYAVTRYRPGSMTHEDFIDEVMDHYLAWRSNMKHAAKTE